jgi:hypothetical protein
MSSPNGIVNAPIRTLKINEKTIIAKLKGSFIFLRINNILEINNIERVIELRMIIWFSRFILKISNVNPR